MRFVPQLRRTTEASFDSKGKPRTKTRHWIEVLNDSDLDALGVRLSTVGDTGGDHLLLPDGSRTIHARQHLDIPVARSFGPTGEWQLRIEWMENGEQRTKDFSVA